VLSHTGRRAAQHKAISREDDIDTAAAAAAKRINNEHVTTIYYSQS